METIEYEEEKPIERCCTCWFIEHDSWYPHMIFCGNSYCEYYGQSRDPWEHCDCWKDENEG